MKPEANENEKDFMVRCLADSTMTQETCALAWKENYAASDNKPSADVAVESLKNALLENFSEELKKLSEKGGQGSGNFGHQGDSPNVGGSGSGGPSHDGGSVAPKLALGASQEMLDKIMQMDEPTRTVVANAYIQKLIKENENPSNLIIGNIGQTRRELRRALYELPDLEIKVNVMKDGKSEMMTAREARLLLFYLPESGSATERKEDDPTEYVVSKII